MEVKAVFVDAAGTLLRPREPVGITYSRFARQYGYHSDPIRVDARFRDALRRHRGQPQRGDGRSFWRPVVSESLGIHDEAVFEALYHWYATPKAWWIDTGALALLAKLAREGVRLGIISNWDSRLRVLYTRFALDRMFPVLICSSEVGVEKPDPWIFSIACRCAGVRPREAIHIGDDKDHDVQGATEAGLVGLPFDEELGWNQLQERIQTVRRLPYF